ncbi:hypothetical protein C7974DRAFT_321479, partial [Boeremia exigua]|uniref:uncharacterized protein n=1 Tax=Boeremia exigua TaxID=749465 RepID=UPI001E8DB636
TLFSSHSTHTVVEIEGATIELQKIFQEDEALVKLYCQALEDTAIGPERLLRNVRRLLKRLGQDLKTEAVKELEILTSRFVSMKATYVAHSIVEEFHNKPLPTGSARLSKEHESDSEPNDDLEHVQPIDEDRFEDLAVLRTFLLESAAFQTFRERLAAFVLPKDRISVSQNVSENMEGNAPYLDTWYPPKKFNATWKRLLVAAGLLEPVLQPGMVRIRWRCECGDQLFDDVQEYREGGISKLTDQVRRSGASYVTATPYREGTSNQHYTFQPLNRIRKAFTTVVNSFQPATQPIDTLPLHNVSDATSPLSSTVPVSSSEPDAVLMVCMHKHEGGKGLRQIYISSIKDSRQLFHLVRREYRLTRETHRLSRHLKQFILRFQDDVEPRLHTPCCNHACQCIPTVHQYEYACTPKGPPDFGPPILPSQLLHYSTHPELIAANETTVLDQMPKRMCGELEATGHLLTEGWGLYYEEDWNTSLILVVVTSVIVLASLLFGICWTVVRSDIQGAWGVSSYMVTTGALILALLSVISRATSR